MAELSYWISTSIRTLVAELSGKVIGSIRAGELVILKSARVEGDVHYDALTIEQGAEVEGQLSHGASAKAAKPTVLTTDDDSTGDDEPRLTLAR